jgi:hypothetical protein
MFAHWGQRLPQTVIYARPEIGRLKTLKCAKHYIRALPRHTSRHPEWQLAAVLLRTAAKTGRCEIALRQLQLALLVTSALDVAPPSPPAVDSAKEWSERDLLELRSCFSAKIPIIRTADFLHRSVAEITIKAKELGLGANDSECSTVGWRALAADAA